MTQFRVSTSVSSAFADGKAMKKGNDQSTGSALFYHGNKIAEWREDGLWISNGGYEPSNGATGSKTTKDKLNCLPSVRLSQHNYKWILNGTEWDGSWINIPDAPVPVIDPEQVGKVFSMEKKYVRSDGWRGYEEPVYAVAGANDTGGWSDSPCPSDVADAELKAIADALKKEGIKVKQTVCETSNVFCAHRYLIPMIKDVAKARQVVSDFLSNNDTRLAYLVD